MATATTAYDRAYGSFLYCGIGALWFALTSPPSGTEALFPLGMTLLLGFLFVVGGFVAVVVAAVSTIKLWRHWPLPTLAVLTAAFLFVEYSYGEYDDFASSVTAARWLYGVFAVSLPLWWFLLERPRRVRSRSQPADSCAA